MSPGDAPPPAPHPSDDRRFLRGVQLSDANGRLRFVTIYPGWYPGRAVHVHLLVRVGGALAGETVAGGHVAHTGQLFFPEETSDAVFTRAPYAAHAGDRVRQTQDFIFLRGGDSGLATLSQTGDGYVAEASIVVDPTATPAVRG
jgi:protocatechuate 3,4-dioxygenase beta subunit